MTEAHHTTTVRLPTKVHGILVRVTTNRGETVSQFIRRLVLEELASLSYLTDDVKKSLGVTTDDTETITDSVS